MAVNYWKAKQDKPGWPMHGACMPGRFPQRWIILYATEIAICDLLGYETGVLVKWDQMIRSTFPFLNLSFRFRKVMDDTAVNGTITRQVAPLNNWTLQIGQPARQIRTTIDQPLDQMLLNAGESFDLFINGDWGVAQPVASLGFQTFATVTAAKAVWPNALDWVWSP